MSALALVMATADGHPRSIAYTSWVPGGTAKGILGHAFYAQLLRAQSGIPLAPAPRNAAGNQVTAAQLAAARSDLQHLGIGWALIWTKHLHPEVGKYLLAAGFRFDRRVLFALDGHNTAGAIVYRYGNGQ
jgi:hypothetical protein